MLSMRSTVKEPCEASTSFADFLVFATLGLNYTALYHFEFFSVCFMKGFKLYLRVYFVHFCLPRMLAPLALFSPLSFYVSKSNFL